MKFSWLVIVLLAAELAHAKLSYQVYTAKTFPDPKVPDGFLVNSTLIMGEKEAVLIDSQFTLSDAHRFVAEILETKKDRRVTTVYVTHQHPDHYFGMPVLKDAFPGARFITRPEILKGMKESSAGKYGFWKPIYGDKLLTAVVFPAAFEGSVLKVDDEELTISAPLQGDDYANSYVWVPQLKMVVTGDIVYSGVHPWTAETNAESRREWMNSIDTIAKLKPLIVIPGHQDPQAKTDDSTLTFMKNYLADFDKAVASSRSSDEVRKKIKDKYPDLRLEDVMLKYGAEAAFPKK